MRRLCLSMLTLFFLGGLMIQGHTIEIRPYGSIGITSVDDSVLDGSTTASSSKINYGGGIQLLFPISKFEGGGLSVGVDTGYMHTWDFETGGTNSETFSYSTLNISAVFEARFAEMFIAQAGTGYYIDLGSYASTTPVIDQGTVFGFHLAAGIDIPVGTNISIPILARGDFIFANEIVTTSGSLGGLTIPLRVLIGVNIKV